MLRYEYIIERNGPEGLVCLVFYLKLRQIARKLLKFLNLCENEPMKDQLLLERITLDPKVMVGKPVIKGTRLTVEFILNLLAHGATTTEILDDYHGLTIEDIQACLLFARESLNRTEFMPLVTETA